MSLLHNILVALGGAFFLLLIIVFVVEIFKTRNQTWTMISPRYLSGYLSVHLEKPNIGKEPA